MEELKLFLDPYWWITVVAVGFIVNIASSYAKPGFDKFLGSISESRKHTLDLKNQKIQEDVAELLKDPAKATDLRLDLIRVHLVILEGLLLTVFMFVLVGMQDKIPGWFFFTFNPHQSQVIIQPILLIGGTVISIMAMILIRKSGEKRDLLNAYLEQKRPPKD